ncbi:unnamed protein product [Effrenium voratum]|uniref:2'-5'-oligoadenylate synthetase 1 domain-containing protein n=1 Tax=Effrenium voratum TaxID=2562239 RepID=A0AA36MKN5_9DINO|nr:unnamed protein product [Effrenium voratum]
MAVNLASYLRQFGESLGPAEHVIKRGDAVLQSLLECILQKAKTKVARVLKAGSVGKGTSLHLKIDFDCVFFLEPGGIPDRFLEDMEDILTLNFGIAAEKKQKSLSFSHKGFYFDFLPAVQSAQAAVKGASGEVQVRAALQSGQKPGSAELVEGTVLFMKEQSGFVHTLARLMKFWSHSLLVPGFFNGRSYTMELLAVAASQDMMDEDMLRGFRMALDKVRNFRNLNVIFERFYTKQDVGLKDSRPLLLDPSNPWNNLLSPDRLIFFEKLAAFADETLRRLDVAHRTAVGLDVLFKPQPDVWFGLPQRPQDCSWLVGTQVTPEVQQPIVRIQSQGLHVESLQLIAHVLALWLATHKPQPDQVRRSVEKAVDTVLVALQDFADLFDLLPLLEFRRFPFDSGKHHFLTGGPLVWPRLGRSRPGQQATSPLNPNMPWPWFL